MTFFGSHKILGINSTPKTLEQWKEEQDKKAVTASKKEAVKTASISNKVESKKEKRASKVVFASSHDQVTDKKAHFPINDENQAKCAVIRIMEAKAAPDWFNGTLKEAQNIILASVKANYPSLKFSSKKEAGHEMLTPQQTGGVPGQSVTTPIGAPGQAVQAADDAQFAPGCDPNCAAKGCKCVDDLCSCDGAKGVPGENGKQEVMGLDMAMTGYASGDTKFVKVSKLEPKEQKWYQKYLELYYPSDYAKAMVADY